MSCIAKTMKKIQCKNPMFLQHFCKQHSENIKDLIPKLDPNNIIQMYEHKGYTSEIRDELEKVIQQPEFDIYRKVYQLKCLKQPEQRSEEWFAMRHNMITASDFSSILTITEKDHQKQENGIFALAKGPKGKIGKSCNPYSTLSEVIHKKVHGATFTGNIATKHGQRYEPVATMIYEHKNATKVHEYGLIQHPKISWIGASPDGIMDNGVMLEIKCPFRRKITGIPPHYYWIQMQIQMECCDLDSCDFEECEIIEYRNKESYENDFEADYKGLILNISNPCSIHRYPRMTCNDCYHDYYYKPLNESDDEFIKNTIVQIIQENPDKIMHKVIQKIYWKLNYYSCVNVKRDKEWFEENLSTFENVWDTIQKTRLENPKKPIHAKTEPILKKNTDDSLEFLDDEE